MKPKIYFSALLFLAIVSKGQSQCVSSYMYSYTGVTNLVWFQDKSTAPANWLRDYTHWNFNDASSTDTNNTATHIFPLPQIYNVVKETKFSEPGNPANFCIVKDSLLINAAMSGSGNVCVPDVSMKVKWLTGSTYGVSNYVSAGCPYNYREIVADTGTTFMPATGPMPGIFTTQQYYFTYNVTLPQYNNTITHHINYPNSHNAGGTENYYRTVPLDLSHQTPTDCHASFFMVPSDSSMHNWTLQDFSTGSDSLLYSWNFGDGNTSTLASPTHTYAGIGMYTICLTVSSGTCSDTYCETAFVDTTINGAGIYSVNSRKMIVTGIKENKNEILTLKAFPNPASNELNIVYPFKNAGYTVLINNMLGQTVLTQKVTGSSLNTLNLHIEELKNGLYQVQVNSDQGSVLARVRFVKQ